MEKKVYISKIVSSDTVLVKSFDSYDEAVIYAKEFELKQLKLHKKCRTSVFGLAASALRTYLYNIYK